MVMISHLNEKIGNTTTPLSSSATFTGPKFSARKYRFIVGTCFADVAGTLRFEFTNDGTNWDGQTDVAIGAGDKKPFVVPVTGDLGRVLYVNGGSGQTTFRLYWNGQK